MVEDKNGQDRVFEYVGKRIGKEEKEVYHVDEKG